MRVKLSPENLHKMFNDLSCMSYGISDVSSITNRHERTIRDWRRGKYLIDDTSYARLVELINVPKSYYSPTYVDESEQRRTAGRIGGAVHWGKYKKIGTIEDKIKGGRQSYVSRKNQEDIFTRKKIKRPRKSKKLAEFVGICMGDGSLSDYQLVISFNRIEDADYVEVVKNIIYNLFAITPSIHERKDSKCTNLVISSVELVAYLTSLELPRGDKLRAGLDIPQWIKGRSEYAEACIRGLMDTDGSIFQEIHYRGDRVYIYPRMMFVSASKNLRMSVNEVLNSLDIAAKIRMDRSVSIERFTDVQKYFRIIGSSNPKHLKRYAEFGGVG